MRLLKITTAYPDYLRRFFSAAPEFTFGTYASLKARFDNDGAFWADFWGDALRPRGYEVFEVTSNAEAIQKLWAKENGVSFSEPDWVWEIPLAQAQRFRPEILWYDQHDSPLLRRLKAGVSSLRLVLGWVGSFVPRTEAWKDVDLILSCAPESVARLRSGGWKSEHLHHAFEPKILDRVPTPTKTSGLSFIGQIIRGTDFHLRREALLVALARSVDLNIYSPSYDFGLRTEAKTLVRKGAYLGFRGLRALGISELARRHAPILRKVSQWGEMPAFQINPRLRPRLRPPVYGLDMYGTIGRSAATLNAHADSSPTHASNLRLFEVTGMGTCLVTDSKQNLGELFDEDREVVVYHSPGECVEKVKWLLSHPAEAEKIARAGQARTLRDHNFAVRAERFHEIVKKLL